MRSRATAISACLLGTIALIWVTASTFPDADTVAVVIRVALLLLAALSLLFLRTLRRLAALATVAERLAAGDLDAMIERPAAGHVGRLERALNETAVRLGQTHDAATTDRLTQVANRGAVLSTLDQEVERAVRHERPLSVAFADIDHFKDVNDTHGHQVGDTVLRAVAGVLRDNLRVSDVVGRFGGEEFMLVLPEATPEEATEVAEKCRILVERCTFAAADGSRIPVTISIGIAGGTGATLQTGSLLQAADQAMYAAKSLGRNQTYVFREPDDGARVPGAPISSAGRTRALEIGAIGRRAAEIALSELITPMPHYRGRPSSLIATIAVVLARDLTLAPQEVERIRVASLLHDIGKIALPQEILEKPAPLTDAEWSFVRQHPRIGQLIIDEAGGLRDAGKIILHHHERFGGHGYPHGLRGKAIPLGSRIVAIADAYDAMVHDRPYKASMSHVEALAELRRHAVTQFDPELVNLFLHRFGEGAPIPDVTLATPISADFVLDIRTARRITA